MEATSDLAKIGLGVDVLTIQKVSDSEGYIEALGKKRTAEVKRDAQIGEASAAREATIQSTTALREGKQKENENLALVALAEKERDVRKALYEADVLSQQATAKQAGPLADAAARQNVVEQEVQVEIVRTRKQTEVAEADALRREKQLLAEVVKPAEAAKQQVILQAEASKQREILEAEGKKTAVITIADAEKQRLAMEGLGAAEALKSKLLAEAEGNKAKLLAEAEGNKAKLLAEAEGIKAKLLAEAEGALRKAEAFAKLDESSRTLLVLERFPELIKAFAPVAAAVAAPLGNIDKLVMIDGGGSGEAGGTVNRLAQTVPTTMFQVMQLSQALGTRHERPPREARDQARGRDETREEGVGRGGRGLPLPEAVHGRRELRPRHRLLEQHLLPVPPRVPRERARPRRGSFDALLVPGGAQFLLLSDYLPKFAWVGRKWISFLVERHRLSRVIVVAHDDCAWYAEERLLPAFLLRFGHDTLPAAERQRRDLGEIAGLLRNLLPSTSVETWFAAKGADGILTFVKS